jgi:hypothetical protein
MRKGVCPAKPWRSGELATTVALISLGVILAGALLGTQQVVKDTALKLLGQAQTTAQTSHGAVDIKWNGIFESRRTKAYNYIVKINISFNNKPPTGGSFKIFVHDINGNIIGGGNRTLITNPAQARTGRQGINVNIPIKHYITDDCPIFFDIYGEGYTPAQGGWVDERNIVVFYFDPSIDENKNRCPRKPTSAPTPIPTNIPIPTETLMPTQIPTNTPVPTITSAPAQTPTPTVSTLTPTPTPSIPIPTSTPTPITITPTPTPSEYCFITSTVSIVDANGKMLRRDELIDYKKWGISNDKQSQTKPSVIFDLPNAMRYFYADILPLGYKPGDLSATKLFYHKGFEILGYKIKECGYTNDASDYFCEGKQGELTKTSAPNIIKNVPLNCGMNYHFQFVVKKSSNEKKILLLKINPYLQSKGKTLVEYYKYRNGREIADKAVEILNRTSGKAVHYKIVQEIEDNDMPKYIGLDNPENSITACLSNLGNSECKCNTNTNKCSSACLEGMANQPCRQDETGINEWLRCTKCLDFAKHRIDYVYLFNKTKLDICGKVNRGEIDEVWVSVHPYSGFHESNMVGPNPFDINGHVIEYEGCSKNVPILGIDHSIYPLDQEGKNDLAVTQAIHSYGHRVERTMQFVYGSWRQPPPENNWEKFSLAPRMNPNSKYDLPYYGCGNIHYTPNSTAPQGYDYYNKSPFVNSNCDAFYNYPNITENTKRINCEEWGCTNQGYFEWWFKHIPNKSGLGSDGKLNNWWEYIINPEIAIQDSSSIQARSADLNNDGVVSAQDLAIVLAGYGRSGKSLLSDIDKDGNVNSLDTSFILQFFGNIVIY